MNRYTVHVIPKHGYLNPRCIEGETIVCFHYEDCTFEHATRLKEINERMQNGDAIITIVKQ